jgi:hypothetical protein
LCKVGGIFLYQNNILSLFTKKKLNIRLTRVNSPTYNSSLGGDMGKKDLQGPCLSPWSHGLLNLKDEVIQFHIPPMLLVA